MKKNLSFLNSKDVESSTYSIRCLLSKTKDPEVEIKENDVRMNACKILSLEGLISRYSVETEQFSEEEKLNPNFKPKSSICITKRRI
jgi:hypothetical protein